ncbi:thiamine diphosphokinase [Oceanispirochaeta sp.]|jgi:thiamine pyrophosphokinase|uniref:thiamine diphosphokinase n=1 Tax=Oceanispirochaeta sp. TaxID=2035350 RepID=UPI002624B032|nr:thiamine diphosphokinase [Oceanispirochaeta sp.]MDA3956155.1 thiamine diphosphokinase [Oceanispirochaeta sp.]
MQGILITGGQRPEYSRISHLLTESCYIVAADSGLDFCLTNDIRPDFILGDMDSLSSRDLLNQFNTDMIEEHSEEKDFTDTELGVMHLQSRGCSPVIVIGGGGGRLDHLLAITVLFDRPNPPDLWITHREEVQYIEDGLKSSGKVNEVISFFPAGTQCCSMHSTGLKWPLDMLHWKKGDAGISNRLVETEFSIVMKSGHLIMIREIQEALGNH